MRDRISGFGKLIGLHKLGQHTISFDLRLDEGVRQLFVRPESQDWGLETFEGVELPALIDLVDEGHITEDDLKDIVRDHEPTLPELLRSAIESLKNKTGVSSVNFDWDAQDTPLVVTIDMEELVSDPFALVSSCLYRMNAFIRGFRKRLNEQQSK